MSKSKSNRKSVASGFSRSPTLMHARLQKTSRFFHEKVKKGIYLFNSIRKQLSLHLVHSVLLKKPLTVHDDTFYSGVGPCAGRPLCEGGSPSLHRRKLTSFYPFFGLLLQNVHGTHYCTSKALILSPTCGRSCGQPGRSDRERQEEGKPE